MDREQRLLILKILARVVTMPPAKPPRKAVRIAHQPCDVGEHHRRRAVGVEGDVTEQSTQYVWRFECPDGWEVIGRWGYGFQVRQKHGGLRVLVDCEFKDDGQPWLHVSYSRKDWTPNHADTVEVKQAFIGNRYAYAVFPPSERYVNIHAHCLHLWARMGDGDGQVLPEFSAELPVVGRSI